MLFGSRVGFSGTAELMVQLSNFKIQDGGIHVLLSHVTLASAGLSCFVMSLYVTPRSRVHELSVSEDFHDASLRLFDTMPACVGRTDTQTDGHADRG